MKLKEIDVQRSKVYVMAEGHTYRYGIEILGRFGEYNVESLSIINGCLYVAVNHTFHLGKNVKGVI